MQALPRPLLRSLAAGLLALAAASAPAAATTLLTDPEGDASAAGPDVIAISAGFSLTELLLDVSFAAGTFDPSNLALQIALDVDLDPDTGTACTPGSFPCGAEYSVVFNSLLDPDTLFLVDLIAQTLVTTVSVSPRTDGFILTVPLGDGALPDDGEVLFGIVVGIPVTSTTFSSRDVAPDASQGGALGGPSTPVPEPASLLLLAAGLAGLASRGAGRSRECSF